MTLRPRRLGNGGMGRRGGGLAGGGSAEVKLLLVVAVHVVLLGAIARYVSWLTAAVAHPARRVHRASVRGSAVAGDVAELATGVAFHGLRLAVAGEVVGASALVARRRALLSDRISTAAAEAADESTASHGRGATSSTRVEGHGAGTLRYVRCWTESSWRAVGIIQCSGRTAGSCGSGQEHQHR